MPSLIRLSLLICACALLTACSSSPAGSPAGAQAPKPVAADAPAAERAVGLFERLAYDLSAAGNDCDQVAAHFSTFSQSHQTDYPTLANQAWHTSLDPEARAAHDQRLRTAVASILAAVEGCGTHAAAQKAYTEFDLLVDPQ
jgi:hypothetical protein